MNIYPEFNNSKYTKWYMNIVQQPNLKENVYSEVHHIIPRCMGGSDEKSNLVRLSYRQHFIAHMLLPRMVDNPSNQRKMWFALSRMTRRNNLVKLSSRQAQMCREAAHQAMKGRVVSESTKQKNREVRATQLKDLDYLERWKEGLSNRTWPEGHHQSNAFKAQQTIKERYGASNMNGVPGAREKKSVSLKAHVRSKEHCAAISASKQDNPFPSGNPMSNEDSRKKVSQSKIGTKSLYKEGKRKLAKPNSEKNGTTL